MTIEFVGAIEIEPPLTSEETAAIRRLARPDEGDTPYDAPTPLSPWWPTRDGTRLTPNRPVPVADCAEWLRYLTTEIASLVPARLGGLVVGHDAATGEVGTIRAGSGRISRRTLRPPREPADRKRSNVIDFASRRRAIS